MVEAEMDEIREVINRRFESGDMHAATDDEVAIYLTALCTGYIRNEMVHPREIIRGLTLNHLQQKRTIGELRETLLELSNASASNERRMFW